MSDSAIPGGFNPGKFRETNFGLPFVTPVQTDEFTQEESDRRLARYMASAKMLDDADLVKLDENQKIGLFRATTKGMFGIEDLDGSFCFGKKSGTVDANIENLRKFAHGDFGVITTDEAKAWSGMDEEQKFQYALEHESRGNKVKSNINGDRGDSLLLRLMMNSGNGMGYAQLPSDSQLEARAESYRRNNYDTMTPEEQARYRADVIGDYERKIAGEQPLATFLSASGQLSDRARWLLADAYSNGSIDIDQMASLDEDERDHVYSTLAAMRGDKKKGRLFTTLWMNEQDFTDDTAMNRVQLALYGGQQAFLEMFTEPFGLARDVAKWAWYKVALDESKRKDAFDRWNAEEKAKQALEQPLPDATTFGGAAIQGLAENWTFWAQYGIADKGAKAFKAASKAAKIAKATEKAAEKFKGRAIAKAFVNAEISGLPKSEADALFAIRSAVICEQYTRRLQKAQAMAKGAKVMEGVGAAEFAAGHLSAYARFVNEYVENADAAGVSREISLPTSILVGAVNEIIERIYVPGLEKNVPGDELKAMMLSSMYRMVKRDGAKGFRRYLEFTLPRFIGQTARVTAQEGFVEEPLQQEVIESATLMDEMRQFNKELDERGVVNDELRKKIDNELENFWRNGWKTFVDTAAEAFPTSFGFGVTSIGNMQIRQYLRDRMRLSKARKAGSDYSVDEGALAFLSRKMNLKKQIFDFWATDEDGNPTIQTKEDKAFYGNEFEKGLREARKIVRDGTGDVAQRIANAMNLDLKGAELVEDFVRIEDTLQKASPTISQIVQGSALVDINEDTIGTILPGYVKGSLVKDDENGVYTAKYKIGDAERTVAYRTKDTYETLVQFALNNPDAYRGSYEAATENDPNAVPWEEFSKDPTSLEKFIRKNVNAYTDNNEANILVTDEDGKQHLIRVDDVVYLMEGRPGDVGYGDSTMTDARHESFHPIWTFLRSTAADKEDVRKFALNQFGIDISDPTGDAKFDDIMAYEYQEHASGNYVSPGVSEFLTKMEQSGFGKFLKSIADKIGITDVATMPDPENPGGRKKIGLGDLYDLIMRGKIGTGWAGVEKAAGGVTAKVGENEVKPSDSGEMPEVDTGSEEKPKEPVQAPAQSVSNPTAPQSEKEPVQSVEYTAENPAPPEVSNAKFYRIQADGEGKVFLVGELEVAEAEDSVTSYNEGYTDPDLQNRGTGTEDSIAAAENIASNLDPRQTSLIQPRANNGIKWVTPSGMVFIGNTRTRGEQLAYERGTAGALDEFVRAQATLHGLTIPEGMRHPTLRFRLIRVESPDGTNISMRDVVRMTNESQQRGMDEVEQAGNDALIFENEDILSGLSFRPDGRIDESKSGEAIGKFRRATGMQGMIGEDGLLTEAGEKRLVSAAIASLIGSSAEHKPLLRKIITDSGRLDIRSQLRALVAAAPMLKEIAKQKPAYDLTNDLSDALRRFVEWRDADESRRIEKGAARRSWRELSENGSRKRGISWERHSSQGDMFDNQTEASKILSEMLAKTESLRSFDREDNESEVGKQRVVSLIGGFLGDFANNARAANPEADMFGTPGTTKEEILSVQRDKKDSFGAPRFSTVSLFNDDNTFNITPDTIGLITPEFADCYFSRDDWFKYNSLVAEKESRASLESNAWPLSQDEIQSIEAFLKPTESVRNAGFIMPDGKLLEFGEKQEHAWSLSSIVKRPSVRHGRVLKFKDGSFLPDDKKALVVAIKSGIIRIASNRGGLELEGRRKLSEEQIDRIRQYVEWANGNTGPDGFSIDYAVNGISDSSSHSVVYPKGTSSDTVLEDIRRYQEDDITSESSGSVYGPEYDQFFSREYWKGGNFSVRADKGRFSVAIGPIGARRIGGRHDRMFDAILQSGARKDRKLVWQNTGWYKGVDGKWRTRVSNGKISKEFENAATVGEILDGADDLFLAYPELKKIRIVHRKLERGTLASLEGSKISIDLEKIKNGVGSAKATYLEDLAVEAEKYREIAADPAISGDSELRSEMASRADEAEEASRNLRKQIESEYGDRVLESIVHEIQHYIQDEEGFARGTNVDYEKELAERRSARLKELFDDVMSQLQKVGRIKDEAKRIEEGQILNFKLLMIKAEDADLQDMIEKNDFYPVYFRSSGEVEARYASHSRNDDPSDRSGEAPWEWMNNSGDRLAVPEHEQTVRFSTISDRARIEKLEKEISRGEYDVTYRAMELAVDEDGRKVLIPPMAGIVDGKLNSPAVEGEWVEPEDLTHLVPKSGRNKGKFPLKYRVTNQETGKTKIQTTWVALNPYIHSSFNPFNDQFSAAYNRPNMVVVRLLVPRSASTGEKTHPLAKNAPGLTEWNYGPVSKQLIALGKPARKVMLSTAAKIDGLLSDSEVADLFDEISNGVKDKLDIPSNVMTPGLRAEFEKRGYRINGKVRFSTRVSDEEWEAAKQEFGLTDNAFEAGYILPDGSMLDFSEKNNGGPGGARTLDHRAIGGVISRKDRPGEQRSAMEDAMSSGAIRVYPEMPGFELRSEPSTSAMWTLREAFDQLKVAPSAGQWGIMVEFSTPYVWNGVETGDYQHQRVEYSPKTSSERVAEDIRTFFRDGILPDGTFDNGQFSAVKSGNYAGVREGALREYQERQNAAIRRTRNDEPMRTMLAKGVTGCRARTNFLGIRSDGVAAETMLMLSTIGNRMELTERARRFFENESPMTDKVIRQIRELTKDGTVKIILKPAMMLPAKKTTRNSTIDDGNGVILRKVDSFTTAFIEHLAKKTGAVPDWTVKSGWLPTDAKLPHERMPFLETGVRASSLDNEFSFIVGGVLFNELPLVHMANMTPNVVGMAAYAVNRNGTLRGMPMDVDIVDGDFVLTPGQDGSIHDVLAKLSPGNARRGYRGYREFVSEMALYPPTILDRINQWEDAWRLCKNPESRMFVKICEQRANNRQAPKTDEELDFEAWDEYRLARLASPVASRTDKTVEVGRSLNGDGRIIMGGDLDLLRGYKDPNGGISSREFYLFARAAIEQIKEQKDNPEISYSQLEDYVVDQMKQINKEFGKDEKQAVGWFHGYVASKFIGTGKHYNRIKGAATKIARKLDENGHIIDRLAKIVKGNGRVVFAYAMHLNSRNIIPRSAAQYLSEEFHRRTGKPCSFVQFNETSNSHLYGKTRAERFNTVLKFETKALFNADDQIVIVDDVVANGTTMAALLNHIVENEHVDPVGAVALSADYQMIDISKGQLFASDSTLQTMSELAKLPQQQIRGILGYGTDRLTDPEARGICNVLRRKGVGGLGSARIHAEGESNDVGRGSFVGEGQANRENGQERPGYSSGANLYLEARDPNTGLYSPEAVRAMDELFKTPGTKSARNRGAGSDLDEVATRRGIDLDAYRASGGKFSARPGDLIAAKQFDSLSSPRFSILNRNIVWSELPESLKTVINSTSLAHLESADRNKVQRDYFYSLMGDRNTWASEKPEARRYAEKLSKQLGTEWLGKYLLAKHFSGDAEAVQVVRHYVKQNAVGAIREAWDQSRPLRIAYIQSQEGTGINRIPLAYAAYLENALGSGATVDGSVVKVSTDQNTRADQKDRVSRDFKFESEGPIDQASQYLIVDDTWTSGQTTVSMLDYLRQQGADVIGITTIATGRYGKKIIPEESQLRRAVEKAKLQSIEQANQVLAFDLRKATGSELHGYILQGKQGPQGLQRWFREVNSPMLPGVLPNQGRVVSGNRENEGASEAAAGRSLTATGSEPTYNGQMVLPGFGRFSSVYPQFNNLSDDDLMSIAVATDIALGKSDKVSDRSVKITRVQKMVKQMHPEYTTAQVGVESARVATDAQRLAKRIREDLERGISESAIISHLPEAYRATFGKEMREQARTGAKIGSKNAKAYLALKGRRDKLIEDAVRVQTGVETKMLENEYGIDLSKTLLAMSENPMDKPPVIHSQPTGAAVVVEDQESDTDAKDVSDAIKNAVDDIVNATKASSELNEQNRRNRENARKGEEERAKTIDGDEGAEGDGDLSGAQDPDIVEQAVRKAEVDIENPRHLAEFVVELARRYWIAKKGLAITANPWIDNVALQFLRKTAQNIYAKLLKDLTFSGRREAAVKAIRDLETVPTVTGLMSEMAYIGSVIHAQRIRDKRHEMVEELDKFLQDEFGARGRFKPDQETLKRKVSAESELRARYMRHAMWLTPTAVAEETQQYLEAIASISVEFDNEGKDKDQSREMMEAIRNLGILREFGGLVYKMPSEIEQAVNYWKDLAQQSGGEVEEANQRREDRTTKAAEVLARAFRNAARKYRAEGVNLSERMSDYIQSHMGFINLIRDMMRYSSETDREIAERIVKYLELEIQKAGTRAMTGKREQGTKFARALEAIYGKDFQKVIEEFNKPDERFAPFMGVVGGKRVQPTKGRAIQLLVSLLQVGRKTEGIDENGDKVIEWVGGYHDNIVKHHREDQAAKISSLLSPEDFNLIDWLARWYELNRSSLSSVSEDLFGIGVYAETSNYFPVKMQLPPQGLEKGSGVSWTIFPKALTPRVRNERDFDTTADILSLFMARMEEAEQWKAHAKLGLELRGIFGRGILQEAVVANHSTKAKNLMLGFITDILAGAGAAERDATSATYWSDKIRGWAALGALGGNAGVMMKQTTSIPAFGFEIGLVKTGKYILSAMTPEGIAAMKIIFNSEERKNRWNVGNTEEVKNALAQSSSSALVNLIKASMFTNKIGDLVPSLVVGQGIYRDALDQGMSHEDALAYTWMLVERTQQSSRVENQAHFQRRTKYGRALYQFLSTQQQYLQYEVMAIRGLAADPANAEKWGKLANALVLNHFILSSLYYWMGQLYKALLGQKPSDDEISEWIVNCVLGPYGALYGIGWTTAEAVNRWICGNKFGSQKTLPSLSFASNVLVNDPASLIESVLSKKKTWDDVLEDLGKWASDFNAVFRDARKVYKNWVKGDRRKKK